MRGAHVAAGRAVLRSGESRPLPPLAEWKCPISPSPKFPLTTANNRFRSSRRRNASGTSLVEGPILRTLAAAGLAQRHRAFRRHLRGDRRDLLYRPARRRIAGRDGAAVSLRDPDHDDVRRRDGRRRGVVDCARARRRRYRARLGAGEPRAPDRPRFWARLRGRHGNLWAETAGIARRPRPGAGQRGRPMRISSLAAHSCPG